MRPGSHEDRAWPPAAEHEAQRLVTIEGETVKATSRTLKRG